jgi:hypothetical protein
MEGDENLNMLYTAGLGAGIFFGVFLGITISLTLTISKKAKK